MTHMDDGASSKPAQRRLHLSDLLIVVALAALGLAPLRLALWGDETAAMLGWLTPFYSAFRRIEMHATPPLFACALCVVALSLRPPRPPLRRLARRPGFVASVLALAAAAHGIVRFTGLMANLQAMTTGDSNREVIGFKYYQATAMAMSGAGLMTMGAWLVIAIAWRWRSGPSWIDRIGCFVGLATLLFLWIDFLYEILSRLDWTPNSFSLR